ncbi:MAG TPA: hypothetical protein DDY68_03570 [Porphyromonadaceae bacterium]|nr:hypothetical protein [Porphyromonadaceae bacterium]
MGISIPLRVNFRKGVIERLDNVKKSIDCFIDLILTSPRHSSISDFDFGFIFMNLKFENFNELDGVVSKGKGGIDDTLTSEHLLYEKKISGTSKNMNTFAAELKETIEKYEKRLTDVSVTMSYVGNQKQVFIIVTGYIPSLKEDYKYETTLNVWNK